MPKSFPAIAVAALLVISCRPGTREDYSHTGPARPYGSAADPNAPPGKTPAGSQPPIGRAMPANNDLGGQRAAPSPQAVAVQLSEYTIEMPGTLSAGDVTLNIANAGKGDHSFMIHGPGLQAGLPEPLKRGDTHALTVNLKPGTYTVWCPVDGHRGKGMQKSVTVR